MVVIQLIEKMYQSREVRYLIVGGTLFFIDFISTLIAYYVFRLGPGMASATGFMIGFLVGFALNKKIVFTHNKRNRFTLRTQVTLYLMLALLNVVFSASLVRWLVVYGLRIEFVKPCVTILIAGWNYVILGRYIFGNHPIH